MQHASYGINAQIVVHSRKTMPALLRHKYGTNHESAYALHNLLVRRSKDESFLQTLAVDD